MLSFFPRDVLDEILNLIESVSKGFPTYSFILSNVRIYDDTVAVCHKKSTLRKNHLYSKRVSRAIRVAEKIWRKGIENRTSLAQIVTVLRG